MFQNTVVWSIFNTRNYLYEWKINNLFTWRDCSKCNLFDWSQHLRPTRHNTPCHLQNKNTEKSCNWKDLIRALKTLFLLTSIVWKIHITTCQNKPNAVSKKIGLWKLLIPISCLSFFLMVWHTWLPAGRRKRPVVVLGLPDVSWSSWPRNCKNSITGNWVRVKEG